MLTETDVEDFVRPEYAGKDFMHDLTHIHRVYALALELGARHPHDAETLLAGAYFHGIVYTREAAIRDFLTAHGIAPERIEGMLRVARESQKDEAADTIEGRLLHDAHLLEGGRTFLITKSLVVGTLRGQTLDQTIRYIEERVLGQFQCYLPETQARYADHEQFAADYLADLKRHLRYERL